MTTSEGRSLTFLVNGFGAYLGGIVTVHNAICRELLAYGSVAVANAPRDQDGIQGLEILSQQSASRKQSFVADLKQALSFRRFDVRIDSAPGFRFFTRSRRHIVVVHDLNFVHRSIHSISTAQFVYRWLLHRWFIRRCDLIVANSPATRAELERFAPGISEKTIVLPLPVGNAFMSGESALVERGSRSPLVRLLSFGHARNKGVDHLLRLMAARDDLLLTVICPSAAWDELWRDEATALGVADRVVVRGGLTDAQVVEAYGEADVFCMLSGYEGYGLPVAESLALARPTVIHDFATLVTTARGHAVVVDAGDLEALSAAIDEARSADPSRWRAAAQEFTSWTWAAWTAAMLEGEAHD